MIAWMGGFCILASQILPLAAAESYLASFPPLSGGAACRSVAVSFDDPLLLVTVVAPGGNPILSGLQIGNRNIPARVTGHDPVTRLGFLKIDGAAASSPPVWLEDARSSLGISLRALAPSGPVKCLATGWVKQIGGKILPLALLRVNFEQAVPPSGTPLVDPENRVVAIVFQSAGSGNSGYAIPAEAVHRVRRDVGNGGHLIRGWLGLTLHSGSQMPRVVRVLPGSPAAEAGIQPADVLMRVGSRQVSDYADAANAFFYLVPGVETVLKIQRGSKQMEFSITPTSPRLE